MRFLRTALLPALLCAAILALGFFAPNIYGHVTPDFKDEPAPVEIAGSDSPIYIESSEDILLPPWDAFNAASAFSVEDCVISMRDVLTDPSFANEQIARYVEPFMNGDQISEKVDFYGSLYLTPTKDFAFLRDFTFEASPGRRFTLDLVLDLNTELPLYLHVLPVGAKTAPAADDWKLHSEFMDAVVFWRDYARDPIYTEKVMTDYLPGLASRLSRDPKIAAFVAAFSNIHAALGGYPEPTEQLIQTDPAQSWLETLAYLSDFSVLTYKDETMFLFTDAYRNYPCVLFFDDLSGCVTGYGLDASMIYPYSYFKEYSD